MFRFCKIGNFYGDGSPPPPPGIGPAKTRGTPDAAATQTPLNKLRFGGGGGGGAHEELLYKTTEETENRKAKRKSRRNGGEIDGGRKTENVRRQKGNANMFEVNKVFYYTLVARYKLPKFFFFSPVPSHRSRANTHFCFVIRRTAAVYTPAANARMKRTRITDGRRKTDSRRRREMERRIKRERERENNNNNNTMALRFPSVRCPIYMDDGTFRRQIVSGRDRRRRRRNTCTRRNRLSFG